MKATTNSVSIASPQPALEAATLARPVHTLGGDLYELTKPRMNFLVVVTTAVGYYMATRGAFEWLPLLHTVIGTALTAAGASVLNQYIERGYDALMNRTSDRPLPGGRISPGYALLYALALGTGGVAWLALAVNGLTAFLGAATLLSYAFVYTPLKRVTSLNTIVGAVPGALPFVMGWTAVHNSIAPHAWALFGILFVWQMPHFLAIAILYRDDYARGGFKMLPVVDPDLAVTGRQIILYSLCLIPASLLPVGLGMAGQMYFTWAVLLGIGFLTFGISAAASGERSDARKLFLASIVYLPVLLAILMVDKVPF